MIDKIRPQDQSLSGSGGARPVRPIDESRPARSTAEAAPRRSDSVQISDQARALAQQADAGSTLSSQRVAEIRQKILQGAYDSTDVMRAVARRILGSGDLDS